MRTTPTQKFSCAETQDTISILNTYMLMWVVDDIVMNELVAAYQIVLVHGFDAPVPMDLRIQCRQLLQLFFDLREIPVMTLMHEN